MQRKKILFQIFLLLIIVLIQTSVAGIQFEKSDNQSKYSDEHITVQDISEKIFMIGRIENLQIVENIITFNPINIWYFGIQRLENETLWYFGNNKDQDKIYCYNESDFKGIITNGFIFGQGQIYEEYRPTVTFQKEDKMYENTLTVVSAQPPDVPWVDIGLLVNGTAKPHGMSGAVTAGDIIDITPIAGIGFYTILISHIPTNTLLGKYDFTGPY